MGKFFVYLGMFIQNNEYSIVMEYLPGGSLFDYIHKKGCRPS
jgi:serine/threonine protein kinase